MEEFKNKTDACHEKCDSITVRPVADVTDEAEGVEISFEIPGTKSDDIALEIKDRLLTLNASSSLHRRGLPVIYKRAFYLSDAVDTGNIKAKVHDGVLTIFLPKAESARTHRIMIE